MDLDRLLVAPELAGTRWSVRVDELTPDGGVVTRYAHGEDRLLRTASVGKVFLLIEVADQIVRGALDPAEPLSKSSTLAVADSGLWQHLSVESLPVVDLARLVGSVSDNWATNALLDRVGLDAVQARATSLTTGGTQLHDYVRDARTPDNPPTLSEGTASDLVELFAGLYRGAVVNKQLSALVMDWLSTNVDLSITASAFGLDPLSHAEPDRGVRLWNKTGTDEGVRADVGVVKAGGAAFAYGVICNWDWDETKTAQAHRDQVLVAMRETGMFVRTSFS